MGLVLPGTASAWTAPLRLSTDNTAGADEQSPDIARAPRGALYAVWTALVGGDFDILLSCRAGEGQPWSAPMNMTFIAGNQTTPRVGVNLNGSTLEISIGMLSVGIMGTGNDGDIALTTATAPATDPCNVTSSGTLTVYNDSRVETAMDMAVDAVGNRYFLSRVDPGGGSGFVVQFWFVAAGQTSGSRLQNLTVGATDAFNPTIDARGIDGTTSRVLVSWDETPGDADGGNDLGFRWSENGGQSFFGPDTPLDDGANSLHSPSVTFGATDEVYQAYARTAGGVNGVWVRRGTFSGSTLVWGPAGQVNTVSPAAAPDIAAYLNNGHAVIAYESGGDVYAATTQDGGASWSEMVVSSAIRTQANPRVAIGSAYVVYESDELVSGDNEPFFSSDVTVTAVPVTGLAAEANGSAVDVSWRLVLPDAVSTMQVLRFDGGAAGATVGEPVAPEADPFVDPTYVVVDSDPHPSRGYVLDVHSVSGGTERYGPVYAASGAEVPPRGAAGCHTAGTAAGTGLTSLLALSALTLARWRRARR